MRWTLISFLFVFAYTSATGQKFIPTDQTGGFSPVNVGLEKVEKRFIPPCVKVKQLKSANINNRNINVVYVNFPEEAKFAFNYAVTIWDQYINSSVPVTIVAKWDQVDKNVLAHSNPTEFYKNFDAAPVRDVYYPISLVEKLSGREWNDPKDADIVCTFNGNASWYFGTDGNTTATQYDFVTAALHEIAHGLGISGFFTEEDGLGKINNHGNAPSIYDYYIFNIAKQRISDNTVFYSPSVELHQQLTSDHLTFGTNEANTSNPAVYAPDSWMDGISIYHINRLQAANPANDELMSPYLNKGKAIHDPGETTINLLTELGWDSRTFRMKEILDIEKTAALIPVKTSTILNQEQYTTYKIIFSTDNFTTTDSAFLAYNETLQFYETQIPVNNFTGKVLYYFKAENGDNTTVTYPKQAPENLLNFKIGPDYYSPQLEHNPITLLSGSNPEIHFKAKASDNLGIASVRIEYLLNGEEQEPIYLNHINSNIYTGNIKFPVQLTKNDNLEYRIIAEDSSTRKNIKIMPANGHYQIKVFESFEPVTEYFTDFNSLSEDFTTTDFNIDVPAGFSNAILHTSSPYPTSNSEDEKYDIIAQLNYPVVLEENGEMSFDEIVLVEPGEYGTVFTNYLFWDYVIVEGSKDNGETWHAFVDGYDSAVDDVWLSRFTNALKSTTSSTAGHENMFRENSINLTDNVFFAAGDTVIFRFRLSSDNSINGWGWAIDNLSIQNSKTEQEDLMTELQANFYPNPCTNNLYIDCREMADSPFVDIQITDLYGRTIYQETKYNIHYNSKLNIDVTNLVAGIYMASVTDSNQNKFSHKIIKN